jgi:carbon storage regulator
MLVLSRKRGEGLVVPDCDLTVIVLAVKRRRVRLGIAAPAEVTVLRDELVRRQKSSGGAAGASATRRSAAKVRNGAER